MLKEFDSLNNNTKGIIIGCVFLFMISFILFTPKVDHTNDKEYKEISKIFENIGNNYNLEIIVNSMEDKRFVYSTDGQIIKIESDKVYLSYLNKWYILDNDNIISTEKLIDKEEIYYNISLIKKALKHCKFENKKDNEIACKMKVSDYVNTRNELNNLTYKVSDNKYITFNIKYDDNINEIDVDYSYVNKIINNEDKELKYNIKISNINNNDYSELKEKISSYVESNEKTIQE